MATETPQVGGLTLWVKRTDKVSARYAEVENVDPRATVSKFIARWVASEKLAVTPSLVSLRLVKRGPAGLPSAEEEADALDSPARLLADPSATLAQAGVTDGSWLLAMVVSQTAATEVSSVTELLAKLEAKLDAKLDTKQLEAALAVVEDRVDAKLDATLLNPWAEISSQSSRLQKEFHGKVVEYYHGQKDALAACMVSGLQVTGDKGVHAAHIWPRHTHGRGLHMFGLEDAFVWDARNGLLLLSTVERAFDLQRAGFFFNGQTFLFIVLDPKLLSETVHGAVKFSELHKEPLHLPNNPTSPFPCRRLLVWHCTQALQNALTKEWQPEAEIAKFVAFVGATEKVDAWLRGVSPEAKWPGVRAAGQAALLALHEASACSDDREADADN